MGREVFNNDHSIPLDYTLDQVVSDVLPLDRALTVFRTIALGMKTKDSDVERLISRFFKMVEDGQVLLYGVGEDLTKLPIAYDHHVDENGKHLIAIAISPLILDEMSFSSGVVSTFNATFAVIATSVEEVDGLVKVGESFMTSAEVGQRDGFLKRQAQS